MKDDATPATKADLHLLHLNLMESMGRRFDKVHDDIDRVLQILINREKEIGSALKDHERRIKRVERRVGIGVS